MTWSKLKEKIEDHIITVVFALITFLCLVIWQAIPSEIWIQLGTVIPKRMLAALIGLLFIVAVTSVAYIFSLRRELKNPQATSQTREQSSPAAQHTTVETYEPNDSEREMLRYLARDDHDPDQTIMMQY